MDSIPHSRGGMITYKDFIRLIESRGYTISNYPVTIDKSSHIVKTFPVKKETIGKVLELTCPENTIFSACGNNHEGGCEREYSVDIKCFGDDNTEPFQSLHHSTPLTKDYHVVSEIITTKILQKEPDKDNPQIQEWAKYVNPMLKIIGSENSCEYPMWNGVYKLFSKDFLNNSFNLYSGEKIIFYLVNPDIDIVYTKFNMKVDIFSKSDKLQELLFVKELTNPDDVIEVHKTLEDIFGE